MHISIAEEITTRFSSALFVFGKVLRFIFFMVFLLALVNKTNGIAGYSQNQIVIFFLIFNFIDISTQLFLRGIYLFRPKVVSGEFDYYLVKPMSPLFRVLAGNTDFMDLITLIMLIIYGILFIIGSSIVITTQQLTFFGLMLIVGWIIALSLHILVAGVGVITTEVDHTIWIYRDLSMMARIPVDVYAAPVREILTFVIPIAVMITFPAKALLGLLSPGWVLFSLLLTSCFLFFSLRFWKYALSQYASTSS